MTNKEIYKILDQLGMIDNDDRDCCESFAEPRFDADEYFAKYTCNDVASVINFVNEIMLDNSQETIKDFLITLLLNNAREENNK